MTTFLKAFSHAYILITLIPEMISFMIRTRWSVTCADLNLGGGRVERVRRHEGRGKRGGKEGKRGRRRGGGEEGEKEGRRRGGGGEEEGKGEERSKFLVLVDRL